MAFRANGFQWDAGNEEKCRKHGVSLDEIEALFRTGPAIYPDLKHSERERRYLAIGRAGTGRWIFLAFCLRRAGGEKLIRPISARYMHAREVARYERENDA